MKTRITISIENDLHRRLRGLAEFSRRSLSNMIEMALSRFVEEEKKKDIENDK